MTASNTQPAGPGTAPSTTQTGESPRVVIADGALHPYHDFQFELDRWARSGIEGRLEGCESERDLIAAAGDADAVAFWGIKLPFTKSVLRELTNCRLIIRYGTGIDSVDLEAASDQGILVATPAGYCTEEVATHATALILSLSRRVPWLDRVISGGGWRTQSQLTDGVQRLSQQTLGLVGFGRIARRVAANLQPMFGRIIATDPYVDENAGKALGVDLIALEGLLRESDFISIHTPLTMETRHLIGIEELKVLKRSAFVVNTSRGAILDEDALADALSAGRLGGAALDVFESTPLPADSPLRDLENVILTPHFAANSDQAKQELYAEVAAMVEDVMFGAPPRGQIHMPITRRR